METYKFPARAYPVRRWNDTRAQDRRGIVNAFVGG